MQRHPPSIRSLSDNDKSLAAYGVSIRVSLYAILSEPKENEEEEIGFLFVSQSARRGEEGRRKKKRSS
jgi:hypothetical protein